MSDKKQIVKKIKDGSNAVYHGAKGVEKAASVKKDDKLITKVKKWASSIKHLCKGLEKAL